ncbi:cyclase/dehydrase [Rhodobacter ferrooxidans]|uniref:Cyclase/dehydrase n=2 Tax=Rhodobacter ferrooxidans TaxID=371731 RepID=C8RZ15_9RHOB|nr:cyclase/dehydrase [Rhodobacter sp. SW2]
MPYTANQMYALVADCDSYPQFLPWAAAARVRSLTPLPGGLPGEQVMVVDLVVSFKVFRERWTSRVTLKPGPHTIRTEYLDGPFKHMLSTWAFRDLETGGCEVEFFVDFEFRNAILQGIIGLVFNEAMVRIVRAFERRAEDLYAPKTV